MANHPNRSCSQARISLYIVRLSTATIGEMSSAFRVAVEEKNALELPTERALGERLIRLIDAVGCYRFGDAWGARVG